jgi:hypothetical protein
MPACLPCGTHAVQLAGFAWCTHGALQDVHDSLEWAADCWRLSVWSTCTRS